VRQETVGTDQFPFVITVKPKVVEPPAGTLPLPLGRTVMTLPVLSQLGEPFQTEETFCGERTVTVAVQLVMEPLVGRIVTSPLNRSPQRCVSR
jgi:hypothetical protein